jgi:hypothetical protein
MDRRCGDGTYGFAVCERQSAITIRLTNVILRNGTLNDTQEEFKAVLGDFDHTVKIDRVEGEQSSHRTVSITNCRWNASD